MGIGGDGAEGGTAAAPPISPGAAWLGGATADADAGNGGEMVTHEPVVTAEGGAGGGGTSSGDGGGVEQGAAAEQLRPPSGSSVATQPRNGAWG